MVETFGTGKLPDAQISQLVEAEFDMRPGAFREYLDLHRPIFQKTAAYGHFGREDDDFTWERTDRADALREAAGAEAPRRNRETPGAGKPRLGRGRVSAVSDLWGAMAPQISESSSRRAWGLAREAAWGGHPRRAARAWVQREGDQAPGRERDGCTRVGRGVYAVGRPDLTREGRWMAAVLACGPDAALEPSQRRSALGLRQGAPDYIEVSVRRSSESSPPGSPLPSSPLPTQLGISPSAEASPSPSRPHLPRPRHRDRPE